MKHKVNTGGKNEELAGRQPQEQSNLSGSMRFGQVDPGAVEGVPIAAREIKDNKGLTKHMGSEPHSAAGGSADKGSSHSQ